MLQAIILILIMTIMSFFLSAFLMIIALNFNLFKINDSNSWINYFIIKTYFIKPTRTLSAAQYINITNSTGLSENSNLSNKQRIKSQIRLTLLYRKLFFQFLKSANSFYIAKHSDSSPNKYKLIPGENKNTFPFIMIPLKLKKTTKVDYGVIRA